MMYSFWLKDKDKCRLWSTNHRLAPKPLERIEEKGAKLSNEVGRNFCKPILHEIYFTYIEMMHR